MLSICIPIYNYDVITLVNDLHNQAVACSFPFEILLMDDASLPEYSLKNSQISLPGVRYISLEQNIGRSKIRNRLAEEAQYPYLIFMDCDSGVVSDSYIKNYLPYCQPGIVCYGGRVYEPEKPHNSVVLRWKYGVERESQTVSERSVNPNYGFCSNNFLIEKELFKRVRFNENLIGYGHEDTFFGLELLGNGVLIKHIDNPLVHLGLEDAHVFMEKTENGLCNLKKVEQLLHEYYPAYEGHSRIMKTKARLEKMHLKILYTFFFKMFKPLFLRNLYGNHPSLFLFDLYKLGYLSALD